MKKMIWIMVKKSIKIFMIVELVILLTYFISFSFYMNVQIAFLSSFFIIVGSSLAYKKMVITKIDANMVEGDRDLVDTIDDPHGLYDEFEINDAPADELDLKAIVQEERKKIKTLSADSIKHGLKGGISFLRLVPYLFLILGFIALKNNDLLDIMVYLPSLLVGIVTGHSVSKNISYM